MYKLKQNNFVIMFTNNKHLCRRLFCSYEELHERMVTFLYETLHVLFN